MSTLSPPKNLTRNVLIGMATGVMIASAFYYGQHLISPSIFSGVEKYIFNLGGQIFKNLLMLVVVPLVFFSLVSGISSLSNMVKLGSIATKTIGLYLFTTGIAVSLALLFGWAFNLSGYEGEVDTFNPATGDSSLYGTVLRIFPNNIFVNDNKGMVSYMKLRLSSTSCDEAAIAPFRDMTKPNLRIRVLYVKNEITGCH